MSKLQVKAKLSQQCVAFLRHKLAQFDTRELEYFRLYDRRYCALREGVWGWCVYLSRQHGLGYGIRCCVSITAHELPYPVTCAVGTRKLGARDWEWLWRDDQFRSTEAGHEAFHWLRHSRQIPGRNYETQANRSGFQWLDNWRALAGTGEGRQP